VSRDEALGDDERETTRAEDSADLTSCSRDIAMSSKMLDR
jgi:hypothetical protein